MSALLKKYAFSTLKKHSKSRPRYHVASTPKVLRKRVRLVDRFAVVEHLNPMDLYTDSLPPRFETRMSVFRWLAHVQPRPI